MMKKEFDAEYSKALNDFILNMEKLPPVIGHPSICKFSEDLCRILRISRFEVLMCVSPIPGMSDKYEFANEVIYADGNFDMDKPYSLKKIVGDGSKVEYAAYPYENAAEWTEDELNKIDVFVKTLFVFNGRSRLMTIADNYVFNDSELGIHNLNYFLRRTADLLSSEQLSDFTCCRFNLKRFSVVNRRFGRNGGTEIMKQYISGLSKIIGDIGMVCRIGGDNFITLFKNEKTEDVKKYLNEATICTGVSGLDKITICARAGYCPISYDCRQINDLIDRVTSAESIVNKNPSLSFVYYDDKTRHKTETSKWIEGLFDNALEEEEFLVYYQPKVDLNDYSICGAEALCRWKHNGEIIQPTRFIPIFEQSNNICILDFYMLEHVCRDIRHWIDESIPVRKISVHMSRINLGSEDLAARIIEIINKYDIPKKYIEIELKETTTDVDFSELKRVVTALHKEGISASVDSFGVRYSSLNLIRELPWNVLKVDKSLLPEDNDENGEQKKIILKFIVGLVHDLGLECIAEGVETPNQIAVLKEVGCFKVQGFYFDRPLSFERFQEKLRNNHCYSVNFESGESRKKHGSSDFIDELLDQI